MITTMVFTVLTWFLKVVNVVIPDWGIPEGIIEEISSHMTTLYHMNFMLPMDTFFIMLISIIGFEIVLLTIRISSGLLSIIRGGGNINI